MPNLFFPGQTDYIEKLNTLATTESVTDGSLAASFLSLVVAGLSTFGGGLQVNAQASAPATPASGFTVFSDASHIPGWKGQNGYLVKLDATANTADRTYTLPNASGTFALLGSAQTFTAVQTVSINSASAALTLTQAGAGAALSTNGQIVSTLGSGTPPLSVVSTTVVANLNAALLNGATFAAPGTIGGGTPGAATFTTLTATGQASFAAGSAAAPSVKVGAEQNGLYSSVANTLDVTLGGVRQFQFGYTASAADYFTVTGSSAGFPVLTVAGASANVATVYATKGTAQHLFCTNGTGAVQLSISHAANAANYWNLSGAATGGIVTFTTQGSDTNVGGYLATKGTGAWRFATGGGDQFRIQNVASSVNFWSAYGVASTFGPTLYADGTDASMNGNYSLKGTGSHVFYTGSTSAVQMVISHVASTVNWPVIFGATTGNAVLIGTGGSDANRSITLTAAGTGTINVTNPLGLKRYTVATLPAATTDRLIIVSDESGGLVPAFSDGTNWRRVTDRAIVS